jgi:hypothetical protein
MRRNPIWLANAPPNRRARTGRLHPTDRWQYKSREVRGGRVAEEDRKVSNLARGAVRTAAFQFAQRTEKTKLSAPRARMRHASDENERLMSDCQYGTMSHDRLESRCRTTAGPALCLQAMMASP